jgi:hypothetical protein
MSGSTEVALGTYADLPGYDAPTFTLMPVGSTLQRSVQVSGFDDISRLTPLQRLVSASCSSGQRFAFGFLQIRSHPRHPCRSANSSPCRASRGLSPPSKCALPGALNEKPPFLGVLLQHLFSVITTTIMTIVPWWYSSAFTPEPKIVFFGFLFRLFHFPVLFRQ